MTVVRAEEVRLAQARRPSTFALKVIMAVTGVVFVAFVFVQSRLVETALFPYAVLLQVTPIVAIAPLIIIWVKDPTASLVICATRLVLLAHHPSDVVAGALIGVIGAMLVGIGLVTPAAPARRGDRVRRVRHRHRHRARAPGDAVHPVPPARQRPWPEARAGGRLSRRASGGDRVVEAAPPA